MRAVRIVSPVLGAGMLVCGCGVDGSVQQSALPLRVSSADELAAALLAVGQGARIELSPGTYAGAFAVPAGVRLFGNGATLVGDERTVLTIEGQSTEPTVIERLEIQSSGLAALAMGGSIVFEDVSLEIASGAGLIVQDADALQLTRVRVTGPVTAASLGEIGEEIDPRQLAALGIAVSNARLRFDDVAISGVAGFGAVFEACTGVWQGGSVRGFVGTGVLVEGGALELDRVEISDGMRGQRLGATSVAYGIVVSAAGQLTTRSTSIQRIQGPGVMQDDACSAHDALTVEDADMAGVWVQNVLMEEAALTLSGATRLVRNRGAGLYLRSAKGVLIDGARVGETIKRPSAAGTRAFDIGDGIQATALSGRVVLRDTALDSNQRIGLLFDGDDDGAPPELTIEGLTIGGVSDYGLHIQRSSLDFRSDVAIDAALEEKDFAADSARVLDTAPAITRFPRSGGESELTGIDGQLMPWIIDGGGFRE